RPAVLRARRARRLPRRPRRPCGARGGNAPKGRRMNVAIRRWNAVSLSFTGGLGVLIALLAFVPVALSANAMQKLTSLYILVILAALGDKLGAGTGISFIELNFFTPRQRLEYVYWAALGTTALLLVAVFVLLRTRLGAALQAIRDDEEAAAAVGVRVGRGKAVLFVLAGLGCGAAGSLTLANQLFVEPTSVFSVDYSALMIFMVLVGGPG